MARTNTNRHRHRHLLLATFLCAVTVSAAPLKTSSISAAPEYPLPRLPRQNSALPPALSPDEMPVFPSPVGDAPPPADAMPTIPSSPSPPNPDAFEPNSAFTPFGSTAAATAAVESPAAPLRVHVAWALAVGLVAMWLVRGV